MDDLLLEKIDHLRERFHVSYKEAREVLEETQGNLVEALILLENKNSQVRAEKVAQQEYRREEFKVKGSELVDQFKELIEQGNLTRIRILHRGRVLLDVPLTASVLLLVVPHLALVSAIAVLFNQVTIQVERRTTASQESVASCDDEECCAAQDTPCCEPTQVEASPEVSPEESEEKPV
ncbi:MAG: DUF4342 domain-containing protein [Symbiobacteriaceae bacterium]|nr:DUF4342 domain-containing protein [Symbiobacteriaceae bacterium]